MSYPQYPQYPADWEPPRPRRSRAGLLAVLVILSLLAVGLIVFIFTNRSEPRGGEVWNGGAGPTPGEINEDTPEPTPEETPETTPEPEPEPELARIGDKVRDGDFTMTVTRLSRAETLPRSVIETKRAKGEFVLVHLSIRHHGDKRRFFYSPVQDLYVGEKSYTATPLFTPEAFVEKFSPGETKKGYLAFDLPEGATPTRISLRDKPASPGVGVSLSR